MSVSRAARRTSLALAAVVGTSVLAAAAPAHAVVVPSPGLPSSASADPTKVNLTFVKRASGLDQPILVTSAPGTSRLFVVERQGRIRTYASGHIAATTYLDLRSEVNSSGGEEGMLGLAFSPDFATTGRLWVTYTTSSGALRLQPLHREQRLGDQGQPVQGEGRPHGPAPDEPEPQRGDARRSARTATCT